MVNFWDIVFQLFFRLAILSTIIHEYGHLLALRVMGYSGEIRSTALNRVYPTQPLTNDFHRIFFYISGGLFQSLVFLAMCIFDRDEEDRLVNKTVAIQGFIYALFEGFASRDWWQIGAMISVVVALIYFGNTLIFKCSQDQ